MASSTVHVPVLLHEVLAWLDPKPGEYFCDGTLGGGGHALELARRVQPGGAVLATDLDADAVARVRQAAGDLPLDAVAASYVDLPELLAQRSSDGANGILLDLGLSSDQFADPTRGFSFQSDGPLDMRFDVDSGEPAWTLINRLRENELADLIYRYGEERFSRRIARRIVEARSPDLRWTARQLAELVRRCVPRSRTHSIDPATRTFQALRIAVNDELDSVETALQRLPDCLKPGGRIAVISFHSLEDRLVKTAFRSDERLACLTRKPIVAGEAEVAANPRSRSAKLRVAERKP